MTADDDGPKPVGTVVDAPLPESSLANMDESTAVAVRRPLNPPKPVGSGRAPYQLRGQPEGSPDQQDGSQSYVAQSSGSISRPNSGGAHSGSAPVFVPGPPQREGVPDSKPTATELHPEAPPHPTRYRVLLAFPFVSALVLAVALALAGPNPEGLYRAEVAIVQGLGFWGCLAAALIFENGDYLRRAWLLETTCYALIFMGDLTLTTGVFSDRAWTPLANGVLTLAANCGAVGGTFLLSRAMRVAGIELPGSAWTRRSVQLLALGVALLAAGPAALFNARQVLAGNQSSLMNFASCMGDIFCFALIAPLALTTIAMRGGLLAWTFGFMTASGLAWLTYDAVSTLSPIVFGISVERARPVLEIARCVACTSAFSAGLAQRWTIIDTVG